MGIAHLTRGERTFYDQLFWRYGNGVFWAVLGGFWRFYEKRPHPSNFTDRIRNQHPKIDQKKFIPLITSRVDPYLTLPLVYHGLLILL